ncbi:MULTISPECIES: hypothetical protein [Sphingobacterium]|uniref:Uncharacterized protein n=1 Tax=Sphingobacterium ginsenosidimutans TaxID=687845 RepID=A0ABP8A2M6_9SPHI|nr:hypothetical protein [Sphingobacterium sp. E70]ULT28485.1 hypothetical protein KUH03_19305 [Sphingobacterium sp. E70]
MAPDHSRDKQGLNQVQTTHRTLIINNLKQTYLSRQMDEDNYRDISAPKAKRRKIISVIHEDDYHLTLIADDTLAQLNELFSVKAGPSNFFIDPVVKWNTYP